MSATSLLPIVSPHFAAARRPDALDAETFATVRAIVDAVRTGGESALRAQARRWGDWPAADDPPGPLLIERPALEAARARLAEDDRRILEEASARIRNFALAQRRTLTDLELPIGGGVMGHTVAPMARAGCYAPGGRYPLPSSVLMTAVTARAAGVESVLVASPRPTDVTLAAAAIAGADALLPIGGAQAIAAMAYGAGPIAACDVIVGPGNRYVTAAKQLVSGSVAIDMLAGPSELLILADESADPALIAADLLAQAEHDEDAAPLLIVLATRLVESVQRELAAQLATLPTADTARRALANGWLVVANSHAEAAVLANTIAPEHLEIMVSDPDQLIPRLHHYGALFIGARAAEVLGDYGLGPNHVLPTGGAARTTGGLSVATFLRTRTYIRIDRDDPPLATTPQDAPGTKPMEAIYRDVAAFARLEGLEAHARAAERRLADAH